MRAVNTPIMVTVGREPPEQREDDRAAMAARYPDGMHGAIAAGLRAALGEQVVVRTATLDQPAHGLTPEVLAKTDVLTWWGHIAHDDVDDAIVEAVHRRVLGGMGLLALHSAHFSKIFIKLMGTTCSLAWRNDGDRELVWTRSPRPRRWRAAADDIPEQEIRRVLRHPGSDELVHSTFSGGEAFRSGCCRRRGMGKVFYFSPGDQDYPVYHHPDIQRVLANGVLWARPDAGTDFVAPAAADRRLPLFERTSPRSPATPPADCADAGRSLGRLEREPVSAPLPAWSAWDGPDANMGAAHTPDAVLVAIAGQEDALRDESRQYGWPRRPASPTGRRRSTVPASSLST